MSTLHSKFHPKLLIMVVAFHKAGKAWWWSYSTCGTSVFLKRNAMLGKCMLRVVGLRLCYWEPVETSSKHVWSFIYPLSDCEHFCIAVLPPRGGHHRAYCVSIQHFFWESTGCSITQLFDWLKFGRWWIFYELINNWENSDFRCEHLLCIQDIGYHRSASIWSLHFF